MVNICVCIVLLLLVLVYVYVWLIKWENIYMKIENDSEMY